MQPPRLPSKEMRFLALLCLVAIAAAATTAPTPPRYRSLGCFMDFETASSELPVFGYYGVTSIYKCRQTCWKLRYRYAGIQDSLGCRCGNTYGRYGRDAESKCNYMCDINPTDICGGLKRVRVFATGANWALKTLGCYRDNEASRDLPLKALLGIRDVNYCLQQCRVLGYRYAGLQYAGHCFCGNSYGKYGKARDAECGMQCVNNRNQICGGSLHSLIYATGISAAQPVILGCYKDTGVQDQKEVYNSYRQLISIRFCIRHCKRLGYKYAGAKASTCCFCSDTYGEHGKASDSACNAACTGNEAEMCGGVGNWLLSSIYATGREAATFHSLGCFYDRDVRDLTWLGNSGRGVTLNNCRHQCAAYGFVYFGVQHGNKCYCGNSYGKYGKAADNDCNIPCTGNGKQICGGSMRQNIYITHVNAHMGSDAGGKPLAPSDELERALNQTVSSDRTGTLVHISQMKMRRFGCFRDATSLSWSRDMQQIALRMIPLSIHYCRWACRQQKYRYFGLQNGWVCFCANSFGKFGQADDSKCNHKCHGSRQEGCGGGYHNSVYATDITKAEAEHTTLGCYYNNKYASDMPVEALSGKKTVSINTCVQTCTDLGFWYAGVWTGSCFCGNRYGRYGRAPDSNCYCRCPGNPWQICGGDSSRTLHVYATKANITIPANLGCYKDQGLYDMTELAKSGLMSINYCRKVCQDLGYRFAGVQDASNCFCGNTFNFFSKADPKMCNSRCSGHYWQICGGSGHRNIYDTGKPGFVFKSMGCYNDKVTRDLPMQASIDKVNLNNCRQYCWRYGYTYFGVQNSTMCNCGNSFGKYGRVEDSRCQKPCKGNRYQICGGVWLNNVYQTGVGNNDETVYNVTTTWNFNFLSLFMG